MEQWQTWRQECLGLGDVARAGLVIKEGAALWRWPCWEGAGKQTDR